MRPGTSTFLRSCNSTKLQFCLCSAHRFIDILPFAFQIPQALWRDLRESLAGVCCDKLQWQTQLPKHTLCSPRGLSPTSWCTSLWNLSTFLQARLDFLVFRFFSGFFSRHFDTFGTVWKLQMAFVACTMHQAAWFCIPQRTQLERLGCPAKLVFYGFLAKTGGSDLHVKINHSLLLFGRCHGWHLWISGFLGQRAQLLPHGGPKPSNNTLWLHLHNGQALEYDHPAPPKWEAFRKAALHWFFHGSGYFEGLAWLRKYKKWFPMPQFAKVSLLLFLLHFWCNFRQGLTQAVEACGSWWGPQQGHLRHPFKHLSTSSQVPMKTCMLHKTTRSDVYYSRTTVLLEGFVWQAWCLEKAAAWPHLLKLPYSARKITSGTSSLQELNLGLKLQCDVAKSGESGGLALHLKFTHAHHISLEMSGHLSLGVHWLQNERSSKTMILVERRSKIRTTIPCWGIVKIIGTKHRKKIQRACISAQACTCICIYHAFMLIPGDLPQLVWVQLRWATSFAELRRN